MQHGTLIISLDELERRHQAGEYKVKRFHALTVMDGPTKGRQIRLSGPGTYTIGRWEGSDILIDDPTISRMHAVLNLRHDGRLDLIDANSANGTYVDGQRLPASAEIEVTAGTKIVFGKLTVFRVDLIDQMDDEFQNSLYEAAVKDFLTGAFTRRYLMENLDREFALSQRHKQNLALMVLDVDHFKAINDTYGHQAGDHVLTRIAEIIQRTLRCEDLLARYGGEEFVILARNLPTEGAKYLAERIRLLISRESFSYQGQAIKVTISIGITSTLARDYQHADELCADGDTMLYRAKRSGRNRSCFYGES